MEKAIALDGPYVYFCVFSKVEGSPVVCRMDLWLVKGGQSLKVILREITDLQEQLEAEAAPGTSAT